MIQTANVSCHHHWKPLNGNVHRNLLMVLTRYSYIHCLQYMLELFLVAFTDAGWISLSVFSFTHTCTILRTFFQVNRLSWLLPWFLISCHYYSEHTGGTSWNSLYPLCQVKRHGCRQGIFSFTPPAYINRRLMDKRQNNLRYAGDTVFVTENEKKTAEYTQ